MGWQEPAVEPRSDRRLDRRVTWERAVFVFFSSRLGCLGSILASALLTLVLLAVFGVL